MTEQTDIQKHSKIPLRLVAASPRFASLNGNNAAWMCVCGKHDLPLIWSAHWWDNATQCPECNRTYVGNSVEKGIPPSEIKEVG